MKRLVPALLILLLAAAAVFIVAGDPFDLVGGGSRDVGPEADGEVLRADPTLAGRARAGEAAEQAPRYDEPVGTIDLHLGTAALQGVVTGAGAPLAGARVVPVLPGKPDVSGVRTRTDGTWEVRGLPDGRFEVRAGATGWRGRTVLAPALAAGQTAAVEPIDLKPLPETRDGVEVKVTDLFGRPLPGAKVLATTMMWGLHLAMGPEMAGVTDVVSKSGITDERGSVLLDGLPPDRYDVAVVREGYVTQGQPGVVAAQGRIVRLTFRLAEGLAIRGVVEDEGGKPVAAAFVTGLHQPSFANANTVLTSADGSFLLDGLREGRYMVIAGHDEHGEQTVNPVVAGTTGTRIRLSGAGRLAVQVVTPAGKPVPSYRIRPYQEQPFGYVYSMSYEVADAEGRTSLTLAPGSWHLSVMSAEGAHRSDDVVKIAAGESASVRIELPQSALVRGVVTDAEGHHVAGAEVYVRRGGFPTVPSREHYARTDAEGRFVVKGLPAGKEVGLHVRHQQHAPTQVKVVPAAGGDAPEITVRLTAGGRVVGTVVGADGAPQPGEQVNLFVGMNFFEFRSAVTDEAGRYEFRAVEPGTYTVSTGPMEAMSRGQSRGGVSVRGEETVTVDFETAAQGTKRLSGVVTRGGEPVAEAGVSAIDSRGYENMVSTTTDRGGRFEVGGLLPGRVTVRVEAPDGSARTVTPTIPAEGDLAPIAIEFGGAGLRARVVDRSGQPVSGAWVSVEMTAGDANDWSRVVAQKTTLQDGSFAAGGLLAGTYQVRVQHQGRAPLLSDPVRVQENETRELGTLTLEEGVTLSGTVTDDAGRAVEDATVSLVDAAGRPVFLFSFATTGSDGRYRVQELATGSYTVKFEARGYAPTTRPVTLTDAPGTLDAVLVRGGEVRVLVEDESGQPVAGARVTLLDSRGQPVTRTLSLVSLMEGSLGLTGEQGRATVPDLAAGAYRVTARKDGMVVLGQEPQALVPGGGTVEVRLTLRRAP